MDEDRKIFIEAFTKFPEETEELIHLNIKNITKNAALSQETRNQGNELFRKKKHDKDDHENIFRLYNRSICFAPYETEELAYGYGNQSALLLHMKMYEASIQNIDKAMKITKLDNFKVKLLCRKVECLAFLDLLEARRTLQEAKDALSEVPENDREILNKLISKAESFLKNIQNPIIISKDNYKKKLLMDLNEKEKENVHKTVMIKHNEKYGKHLVASRDIEPGELVIVEKFYTTCLSANKTFTCCHHCLNACWSGIPCNDCVWAIFCSEECKTKALETYHDIEYCLIPYIRMAFDNFVFDDHICIRVLIKAIKEAGSISELRAQLKAIDKTNTEELLKNTNFEKKFSSLYTLLQTDIVLDKSLNFSLIARVVMIFLAKYTSLFGENFKFSTLSDLMKNDDFLFVGSLYTTIFKMAQINCYAISSTRQNGNYNHSDEHVHGLKFLCSRGSGLTILCNFLNHSCDSNVRKCFTNDNRIVIFATQHIKKDSQVFQSYGHHYSEAPKVERKKLLNKYGFTCDCKACKYNWPAYLTNMENDHIDNYLKNIKIGLDFENLKILTELKRTNYRCDKTILSLLSQIVKRGSKNMLYEPSLTICLFYAFVDLLFGRMFGLDDDVLG